MSEAIELIKEYRDASIKALDFYLDYIYSLTDNFFDGEELKKEFSHDEKLEELIKGCAKNASIYEKVRTKLLKNDFYLSALEINYIGLAFFFWEKVSERRIETMKKSCEIAKRIEQKLLRNQIDRSQIIEIIEKS